MSQLINIADAVVSEINNAPGGTFSEAVTARRSVLPKSDLAELTELKVTVVPKRVDITRASRLGRQVDVTVDIGIQQKVGTDLEADVERLMEVVEQIADFLDGRALAGAGQAVYVQLRNEPVYSPELLNEQRVFTSVLTIMYRTLR